jgi:hypothetical protein
MKNREHDRIRTLLQQALPSVGNDPEPARDLWPELQARMEQAHAPSQARSAVPWFDWVLAGGVALVAIAFPASIPVLLYYL